MTETLQRPARPSPTQSHGRSAGIVLAGLRAALVAGLLGLLVVVVPVLALWAVDDRAGAGLADAVRTGAQLWLVAHGASLEVPGGEYGLTPLGLLAVPGWLLLRAGRAPGSGSPGLGSPDLGRPDPRGLLLHAAAVAVHYATLTGTVSLL